MSIIRCTQRVLAFACLCVCLASTADAAIIGPGSSTAAGILDNGMSGGSNSFAGRLNISREFTNLAAGSYNVKSFSWKELDESTNADLQPFLAKLTDATNRVYEILWAGPIGTGNGGAGEYSVSYMGESFSLAAATDVYAGFNQEANIIPFNIRSIVATTDHQGTELGPDFSLTAGDSYTGFSRPNLPREYAFDIEVEPTAVPEPSSIAVFAIGAVGIVGLRIRRRKNR